ncbi:MAG: DUF4349 domain-containing protein [Chitinophagales bacterium]|nr:DUF4349 domain-containing protein [Chitinophagales bacterium]
MKNRFLRTAIYSLFILLLFSQCKQKEKEEAAAEVVTEAVALDLAMPSKDASAEPLPANQPNSIPVKNTDSAIERMLTKEGTLIWETSNVEKSHAAMLSQAKKYNAYISNDNQTRNDYQTTTRMEIRIPSDKFDAFISNLEKDVTKFDEKSIEVLDVTEEFIDVSARMKTKKELEQHYYDLLKQTKNVSEVLQVEEQLNTVRADIESAEGRLKYLKDKVSMSTLHLTFYETTSAPVGFFGEIGKSFVSGWKGFLYFVLGIIAAWPLVLIFSLFIYWFIKRRRNKK